MMIVRLSEYQLDCDLNFLSFFLFAPTLMSKQANSLVPRDPAKFKRAIRNSYIAIALLLEQKGQDGKISYEIIGFARAISDGYGHNVDIKPCVMTIFLKKENDSACEPLSTNQYVTFSSCNAEHL